MPLAYNASRLQCLSLTMPLAYNASRLQCLSLTMPWTLQKKLETEHSALSSDYRRVLVYVIYYKYINIIAYNLKV